ncbi:MAG: hypothetical protein NTX96_00850 [Candidatus Zambryskibacteria bacterium]|nr:hypothetical protein [Candidatus Zambryskibacteria bacterium]
MSSVRDNPVRDKNEMLFARTNELATLSKAKYLIRCDAHYAFDKCFDVKMMAETQDNWTMVPGIQKFWLFGY